jgi:hypothetical protein
MFVRYDVLCRPIDGGRVLVVIAVVLEHLYGRGTNVLLNA